MLWKARQENYIATSPIKKILAANVKKYRLKRGWSQENLAEKLGMSGAYICKIETAKTWLSDTALQDLSIALGVTYMDLLSGAKIPMKTSHGPKITLSDAIKAIGKEWPSVMIRKRTKTHQNENGINAKAPICKTAIRKRDSKRHP